MADSELVEPIVPPLELGGFLQREGDVVQAGPSLVCGVLGLRRTDSVRLGVSTASAEGLVLQGLFSRENFRSGTPSGRLRKFGPSAERARLCSPWGAATGYLAAARAAEIDREVEAGDLAPVAMG